MKRGTQILVALAVPGGIVFLLGRWLWNRLRGWREEGDPKLAAIARAYADRQEYIDSMVVRGAMPVVPAPVVHRMIDGPTSRYTEPAWATWATA